jgi:uncharacterized membrane protein YedE/YeeE
MAANSAYMSSYSVQQEGFMPALNRMTGTRKQSASRKAARLAAAVAAIAMLTLSGCVAYPASPYYGGYYGGAAYTYAPAYYAPTPEVVIGGGGFGYGSGYRGGYGYGRHEHY